MYLIIILLCLANVFAGLPPQNPVIGVYTQAIKATKSISYIAASYVKFIEMSGAQVVPIFSFSDTEVLLEKLKKLNGVLFPGSCEFYVGGAMPFSMDNQWTRNADAILKYAMEQNRNGNPFPIFGTCLGFQLLGYLTANYDQSILETINGNVDVIEPVKLTGQKSYLLETFNKDQIQKMTKGHGLVLYSHHRGIKINTFTQNQLLRKFWNLIGTSTSPYNEEFVAIMESKEYPIFAVQFHPEKNLYEWKVTADRSAEGAEIVQIMSNRFIEIARKNKNRFNSAQQFTEASIYNYKATIGSLFTQEYKFNEVPRVEKGQIRKGWQT